VALALPVAGDGPAAAMIGGLVAIQAAYAAAVVRAARRRGLIGR